MLSRKFWDAFRSQVKVFARARRGNVAMIFALSLIPITIAAGAGLDLSRALMVRARLAEALDAAGLAIGASQNLSSDNIKSLAQAYFKANYTADSSFGIPAAVDVKTQDQQVILSTSVSMPTTLMNVVGIKTISVGYSSKIVWGQTKLWVSLVLDNTGSMCQPYKTDAPCDSPPKGSVTKIAALITATHNLLNILKSASAHTNDVLVSIVPFAKDVNIGTSHVSDKWINWSDWESAPANGTPSTSDGPGADCPWSTGRNGEGFTCQSTPVNNSSTVSKIPSTGTYAGYFCPSVDSGSANSGRASRYYNGCYDSTATTTVKTKTIDTGKNATCGSTSNCTCTGTGSSRKCVQTTTTVGAPYTHKWIVNDHSTWSGCVMDRDQDNDVGIATPSGSSTNFYAENTTTCINATKSSIKLAPMQPLTDARSDDGSTTPLSKAIDAMQANGNTNQTIGIIHGLQSLVPGDPYNAGTLPNDTTMVLIILSDGLNTQNRWSGTASDIDAREKLACKAARDKGAVIYSVFVDLNGAQGNSAPLQDCATDSAHYFDLTSADQIDTAFKAIGTAITQLRVAQ